MSKILMINIKGTPYPATITNHSLSIGHKLGLLKGSQITNVLEDTNMLNVIYLALIGLDKKPIMSFEEFLKSILKNGDENEIKETYTKLIEIATFKTENKFAKGIEKNIKRGYQQGEKRVKPIKLNFECVEDRYTIYCLVYGIDSYVFWHYPIPDVERIFENITAYKSWQMNPVTNG